MLTSSKVSVTMVKLTKRVWEKIKMLTENTRMTVYHACVLSTLLYDSESYVDRLLTPSAASTP